MASVLRLLIVAVSFFAALKAVAQDDAADVPCQKLQADNDRYKTYFLIGPRKGENEPAGGYNLLVVLPGGEGSAAFLPFVKRLYKYGGHRTSGWRRRAGRRASAITLCSTSDRTN